MGKINMNELTKEQIQKAMACETVEELMELAKSEGIELTKEEAEAYLAEMEDVELDEEMLQKTAGGGSYCPTHCFGRHCALKSNCNAKRGFIHGKIPILHIKTTKESCEKK